MNHKIPNAMTMMPPNAMRRSPTVRTRRLERGLGAGRGHGTDRRPPTCDTPTPPRPSASSVQNRQTCAANIAGDARTKARASYT